MSNVIRLSSARTRRTASDRTVEPAVLNASALNDTFGSLDDSLKGLDDSLKALDDSLKPLDDSLKGLDDSPGIESESNAENSVSSAVLGHRSLAWEEEESMLDQLDRRDRLRLVEFVCSFAWADLEIQPEERVFISHLIRRLDLGEDDDLQVQQWLDRPPQIDDLDPTVIPAAHRRVFVEAIQGLIEADGEISEEERDSFEIFKQLLGD